MIFKNKRGEVPWYVIGLIIALVVLLLILAGPVRKLFATQTDVGNTAQDTCALAVKGASCQEQNTEGKCPSGTRMPGICPDKDGKKYICCSAS